MKFEELNIQLTRFQELTEPVIRWHNIYPLFARY